MFASAPLGRRSLSVRVKVDCIEALLHWKKWKISLYFSAGDKKGSYWIYFCPVWTNLKNEFVFEFENLSIKFMLSSIQNKMNFFYRQYLISTNAFGQMEFVGGENKTRAKVNSYITLFIESAERAISTR